MRGQAVIGCTAIVLLLIVSALVANKFLPDAIAKLFEGDAEGASRFALVTIGIAGVIFFVLNLVYQPAVLHGEKEKEIKRLQNTYEKQEGLQVKVFSKEIKNSPMVFIEIFNPNAKTVTDLSVELKEMALVLSDARRINVAESFDPSNRSFVSGDNPDVSAPILSKRKRLVYIGARNDTSFMFLTRENAPIDEWWEQTSELDLKSSMPSFSEWVFRSEIELAINGQVDGNPITEQPFKMWIEVRDRLSHWYQQSGVWKKQDEFPIKQTNLLAGELQNGSKEDNQEANSTPKMGRF